MDEALKAKILDVLEGQHLMALATVRSDGYPQATMVNYIHDGLTLYFAADATSQKAGNIKINAKVSVAIASETADFYKLRGLSLSGLRRRQTEGRGALLAPIPPVATVAALCSRGSQAASDVRDRTHSDFCRRLCVRVRHELSARVVRSASSSYGSRTAVAGLMPWRRPRGTSEPRAL